MQSVRKSIFWSMGEVSLQGMGHLQGALSLADERYLCLQTKLSPMCPDRTERRSNWRLKRTARNLAWALALEVQRGGHDERRTGGA